MTKADHTGTSQLVGFLTNENLLSDLMEGYTISEPTANDGSGLYAVSGTNVNLIANAVSNSERLLPGKFTAADAIKVVVSQNGSSTGADPGATQGAAVLYLVTATPS